jgi:hypothetical protein
VKVLDFGIAKQVGVAEGTNASTFVTQQGMIVGTIYYMSPEQALGRQLDGRTDVFSLGVVMYEMATGRLPFTGESITETMTKIIRDEQQPPVTVNPGITPALNGLIQRCLSKNRDERFTAAELLTALDAQLGRASTTPYTSAQQNVPTVISAARPQPQTVREEAAPRQSALPVIAIVAVLVVAGLAAAAYWMSRPKAPAAVAVAAPQPKPQPPSIAAVTVTEKPVIIESPHVVATPATPSERAPAAQKEEPQPQAATEPPPPEPQPAFTAAEPARDADALYATAMQQIVSGDANEARKTLHRVLKQDPHYAKAHFRMGEIALLNRNGRGANDELQQALNDAPRLDEREQQLARVGLAITNHERVEAERLAADLWQRWPGDPDLTRIAATYPGMFIDLTRQRGRRRLRP